MGNNRLRIGVDLPTLEARIRNNGRIFSRQYTDLSQKQVQRRAQKLGKVISIRKVPLWDIMGSVETRKSLRDIVGQAAAPMSDVMLEGKSLEEILFPKRGRAERRDRKRERRERAEGLTAGQGE